MNWWRKIFDRKRLEHQLETELQFHIEQQIQENIATGMSEQEARRAALAMFGSRPSIKDDVREAWGWTWIERCIQDLRYAARVLSRSPAFTIVTVLILGIGIGSTCTVFTQVNAVLWNPLPVSHPEQLRAIHWESPVLKGRPGLFSFTAFRSLRDNVHLSDLACTWAIRNSMAEWGPLSFQLVTGNYFRMLGVNAILGRVLTPDDDLPGNPSQVAVINYRLWQRAYGGDRSVLGRNIVINKIPYQIVGVLPEGFAGLDPTLPREVMLPYAARQFIGAFGQREENSWNACGEVVGRVLPGMSDEQVQAESQAVLNDAIFVNPPKEAQDARIVLTPARNGFGPETLRRRTSQALFLLIATAAVILMITCANTAGLLLARGRARQKELATRLAVGAARSRIVRQLLTESLLLSAAGGVLGIVLAYLAVPLLPELLSEISGMRQQWMNPTLTLGVDVRPDTRVLGFSLALTILTGIAFGLLPALRTTRLDLIAMMKQPSGQSATGRFRFHSGKVMVALQVSLCLLLLIGAGLFIRTVANLMRGAVGYTPEGLIFVTVDPSRSPDSFMNETVRALESTAGVESVAVSQWALYNSGGALDKRPVCVPSNSSVENAIDVEPVTARYFETWGVRLIAGREFDASGRDVGKSAIVNEAFANRFFKNQSPLGQEISVFKCPNLPRTIVGVVADHQDRQRAPLTPMVYVAYPIGPRARTVPTTFAARTMADSQQLVPTLRRMMLNAGANVEGDVMTGVAYKEREWKKERLLMGFLVFFGFLALLISCLGIYALLAYSVNWRTAEIGIRMALGAQRPAVIRMVVRESLVPVIVGMGAGLIAAALLTRFVESILFGVSKFDPWTIAAASLVLAFAAALAALLPARRAACIEPIRALRYE